MEGVLEIIEDWLRKYTSKYPVVYVLIAAVISLSFFIWIMKLFNFFG